MTECYSEIAFLCQTKFSAVFFPYFFTVHLATVKNAPLRFWETICIYFITFEHVFRNAVCVESLLLPRDLRCCTRKKL